MEFCVPACEYGHHDGGTWGHRILCGYASLLLEYQMLAEYLESNNLLQVHHGTWTTPIHLQVCNVNRISTTSSVNYGFCTNTRRTRESGVGEIPEIGKTEEKTQGKARQEW